MKQEKGFTLIELLVVIAILGVLAGIAVPQLMAYRNQGYCSRVMSDARYAFTAMEAYYAQHLEYGTLSDVGFSSSHKVSLQLISTAPLAVSATDDTKLCPKGDVYTLSAQGGTGIWN